MDFNRLHKILLLLITHVCTVPCILGDDTIGFNLDCTNDFEELISCKVEQANCTEHSLTLRGSSEAKNCSLEQCGIAIGWCCCSVQMILIYGSEHLVTVWDRGRPMGSKTFAVEKSVKPKTPTIISVNETNGNFEILWDNEMTGFVKDYLRSELTYYKEGDTVKKNISVKHTTVKGLSYYKLSGRLLEPSTTYLLSVRSISDWSNMTSDSSPEWPFITSPSSDSLLMIVIIFSSFAAVIIITVIYCCCAKFKAKWWDSVVHPTPKVLLLHSSKQEVLKPVPPLISSVCVVPLDSNDYNPWSKVSVSDSSSGIFPHSAISIGSSHHSYSITDSVDVIVCVQRALANAFPIINLMSPLAPDPLIENKVLSSPDGSCEFINKTYSSSPVSPIDPRPIMVDPSDVKSQTEMLCDPFYLSTDNDVTGCGLQQESTFSLPAPQDLISSSLFSSSVMTDMSYQPCSADSGKITNDSSFSSGSSSTNTAITSNLESKNSVDQKQNDMEATACAKNPTVGSHSFSALDVNNTAFHSLTKDTSPHVSQNMFSFLGFNNHQETEQIPFLQFFASGQPGSLLTDNDYHRV